MVCIHEGTPRGYRNEYRVRTSENTDLVRRWMHKLRSFGDALAGGTSRAEGCRKRAVPAAQEHYVRVRLVEVVVKRGKNNYPVHITLSRPCRAGTATKKAVAALSPPGHQARTADAARP